VEAEVIHGLQSEEITVVRGADPERDTQEGNETNGGHTEEQREKGTGAVHQDLEDQGLAHQFADAVPMSGHAHGLDLLEQSGPVVGRGHVTGVIQGHRHEAGGHALVLQTPGKVRMKNLLS